MPTDYGYLRMSTNKQTDSPDTQKAIIMEQVRKDGHDPARVVWILDAAISAGLPLHERKGGKALSDALKPGDSVYVSKLDRAFRRAADCATVLDRWQRLKIHFCVVNLLGMAIDLSSPIGKFIVLVLAAVAELEREFARERTRDGLAARKRKGHATGKYPGYGFRWERRWDRERLKHVKVKVADEEERRVMKEIASWRHEGRSWDEIHRHIVYGLKLVTKDGKPWTMSRIVRAFQAELLLDPIEFRRTDGEPANEPNDDR